MFRSTRRSCCSPRPAFRTRLRVPENPRALYFNDRVVVGYIPGAPVIELASHDPSQGVIFQTLKQDAWLPAQFARPDRCLSCHLSANSMEVPGILVRSMFTGVDGRAMPQLGSFLIDHRAPLEQRWGGWYVTGTHGKARHMGNATVVDPANAEAAISEATLNRIDAARSRRHRGISARDQRHRGLMVFDHQGQAINLLTRLGWETRVAIAEGRLDFSRGDLRELARETAEYLAFSGETALTGPVRGVAEFTRSFSGGGPRDRKGRSLRELDLQTRLFRVPLQLHDLFAGVRRAAGACENGGARAAPRGRHRSRHDRDPWTTRKQVGGNEPTSL